MERRGTIRLEGHFSFDALSPDGRTMYLIEYLSEHDVTRYAVRAYDLQRAPADPRRDRGPARARRADERPADEPRHERGRALGVHALRRPPSTPSSMRSTPSGGKAFCIDLDALAGRRNGMWGVKLEFDGPGTLGVVARRQAARRAWTRERCA